MDGQQEIYLEPKPDGSSYALTGANAQIHLCRSYKASRDSGLVKSTVLVDYRWETKVYNGNLVAVHTDGDFLAYILHGREGCHVRIFHRPSKNRALIKNFSGQALDLSWAFFSKPVYLGVVDQGGSLFVYRVACHANELKVAKYFNLKRENFDPVLSANYRLVWCPYVVDETAPDSSSMVQKPKLNNADADESSSNNNLGKVDGPDAVSGGSVTDADSSDPSNANHLRSFGLLALSYGHTVEVLDLEPLIENHGREVDVAGCQHGFAKFSSRGEILGLAISPDATALAVANQTGEVVFYIMESLYEIREAHHWVPHQGRPVTAIYFLDDVTFSGKDAHFWRYALTTSEGNRELKIYNCENWTCVNTLKISSPGSQTSDNRPLVISMDWTANYVFISDIDRKSLYIVQISQSGANAKFVSFSEFPLVQPILSMAVVEASKKRFRPFSPGGFYDLDRSDDGEEECERVAGIRALLYIVNPKSLLELEIRYQPNIFDGGDSQFDSTASFKLDSFHDELSDVSLDATLHTEPVAPVGEFKKILTLSNNLVDVSSPDGTPTPILGGSPVNLEANHKNGSKSDDRQVSNSPSSQEVRSILSRAGALPIVDQTQPPPPSYNNDDADVIEPPLTSPHLHADTCGVVPLPPTMSIADAAVQPTSASSSDPTSLDRALCHDDLHDQFDRIFNFMKKQEDELQCLKLALINQSELLQGVAASVYTSEQQMKSNEDLLKAYHQSFGPENFERHLARVLEQWVQQQLEACVKNEVKSAVYEGLGTISQNVTETVQIELGRKLSLVESTLCDSLPKIVQSKVVLEALGKACGQSVADHALSCYKETFRTVVAPSFDSASRTWFNQINDIFRTGTADYLNQLERETSANRTNLEDLKNSVSSHITSVGDHLKSSFDKQTKSLLAHVQSGVEKSVHQNVSKILEENFSASLKHLVKDELKKAFAENQQQLGDVVLKAMRSQAATPVVSSSPRTDRQSLQKEIDVFLRQNNVASAFQKALSALDLPLVTYVCGKIPATDLFSTNPCPLTQPIILSLIQQLSNDLTSQADLKLRYLIEAVTSIDTKNLQLQQSVNRVIEQLKCNLDLFSRTPASVPFSRQVKMLLLAAQSLPK